MRCSSVCDKCPLNNNGEGVDIDFRVGESKTVKCVKEISNESIRFIDYYTHFKNGLYLVSGGLLEQPSVYIQAMRIIADTVSGLEREETKRKVKTNGKKKRN